MNKHDTREFGEVASGRMDQSAEGNDALSRRLRQFYDSVQEEALPDRFVHLLELLGQAEQRQAAAIRIVKD